MPFLKKRHARRSSKRVSKARRPVLSPPERAEALHCAFRNPRGRTASSVRHAAGSRFFLRIALPHPPLSLRHTRRSSKRVSKARRTAFCRLNTPKHNLLCLA